MRVILGVLSLLVVVAVVGFLAKKQVKSVVAPGNVQQQSQAIQQQFKAAAEAAVQQARPVPDDK